MSKTTPEFPIYIPSKGRSDITRGTTDMLDEAGIDYNVVVEPQDLVVYRQRYGDKAIVLPANDRGNFYVRRYIHHLARKDGHHYHWQMDDDVRRFVYRSPVTKQTTVPVGKALRAIEQETLRFKNIGMSGTNQNSWPPSKHASKFNSFPVQCMLIRNDVKARYRCTGGNLVDLDFVLQVLTEGLCTIMFDHLRVDTPPIGTNQGGCYTMYRDQSKMIAAAEQMVEWYPTLSYVEDEKGVHLRRNRIWSQFTQQPIRA